MQATNHTTKGRAGNTLRRWLGGLALVLLAGTAQAAITVSLTTPANNTVVAAPGSFTITASISVTQGSPIQTVSFYAGTTLLGTITAPPGPTAPALPGAAAGAPINTTGTTTYTWNWTNVPMGIYSLTAVATDKKGITATSAPVTVIADVPPTVSLTGPANNTVVTAPATFTFSAAAAAPIGTITKVEYYNGATLVGTATTAPYTFSWASIPYGTYSITAKATDNWGFTNTTAPITVISNQPPTTNLTAPAANTVITAPATFTLAANAADIDGTIAKVDFYATNTKTGALTAIGTATAAPYTINWANVPYGSYSLTSVATDNYGASTTSAAIPVISNQPPTVSLTSPANNTVALAPGSFSLGANAADVDGTVSKVDFYANNGTSNTLVGTVTAAPYTYTWANVPAGIYTITAKATDNYGASTTSAQTTVISDTPPTVNLTSPANNAVSTAPGTFALSAAAASQIGSIAKVAFYNGTTLIGTATTGTAGAYSYTWSNVPSGNYSLTAVATDGYGIAATSSAVNVTSLIATTTVLASYLNPSTLNAPVTLEAIVSDSNGQKLCAAGNVNFYDGTTLLGTASIGPASSTFSPQLGWIYYTSGCRALFKTSALTLGSHNLTASYVGNSVYAPSTSAVLTQTVNPKIVTTTVLWSYPNPSSLNAPVILQARVNPPPNSGYCLAGDKVNFYDGTILLGTASITLINTGVLSNGLMTSDCYAVLNTSALTQGTHNLTASYVESPMYAASTSAVLTQTVGPKLATTTVLSSNLNPSSSNALIALQAIVNTTTYNGGLSGTVNFWDGTTLLGTANLTFIGYSSYSATLYTSALHPGTHNLTASYVESPMYAASTSGVLLQVVNSAASTTTLATNPTYSTTGSAVALTAAVTGSSPSGTVTFSDNVAGVLGTATIVAGKATLNYAFNTVGTHTLTAAYGGDFTNGPSTSTPVTQTVSIGISKTALSITPNPSLAGQTIALTATITGAIPSGTVTFKEGANVLGTASVAAGKATFNTTFVVGTYNLTATYSGDTNNVASASPIVKAYVVATLSGINKVYYIHTDQLDTTRLITDTSGNVVWQWDNADPFGNNTPNENPSNQGQFSFNLRFPGQYADKETNTYYNINRDYDPSRGGYIESDPTGLGGGLNTYGYVDANPLSWVDPLGLKIDYGGYVLINAHVKTNFELLNSLIVKSGISDECFVLRVTGGDRYRDSSNPKVIRSLTNNSVVPNADPKSPHLIERGARSIDFTVENKSQCKCNPVSDSLVDQLLMQTDFSAVNTRRNYPEGPHTHINLPDETKYYAGH